MSHKKFSVLVMRDDSKVWRMRVHPFMFKLVMYFLGFLVVCAGTGMYGGYYFWKDNRVLNSRIQSMQRTIATSQMELKRLRNIELLLQEDETHEDIHSLMVGSGEDTANRTAEPPIDLLQILGSIDKHVLIASNVQVKFIGKSMNISFDINKRDQDNHNTIKGDVKMHLVSVNGEIFPLDSQKEMFFELRKMKQYRVRVPIPDSYSKDDIFGIRITINHPPHETVFCETYPLSDILL